MEGQMTCKGDSKTANMKEVDRNVTRHATNLATKYHGIYRSWSKGTRKRSNILFRMVSGQVAITSHLPQGFLEPVFTRSGGTWGSVAVLGASANDMLFCSGMFGGSLALYTVWEDEEPRLSISCSLFPKWRIPYNRLRQMMYGLEGTRGNALERLNTSVYCPEQWFPYHRTSMKGPWNTRHHSGGASVEVRGDHV